jgi:hypothetical protein
MEALSNNKNSLKKTKDTSEIIHKIQQSSFTQNLPKEIKVSKSRSIKKVAAFLILLVLITVGIALNWNYLSLLFVNQVGTDNVTQPPLQKDKDMTDISDSTLSPGTRIIKISPGLAKENKFLLPDGETRILFGNIGREDSVPDLVFGGSYVLNDIHNINYYPIRSEVSFYNNGYFIALQNLGCNTEKGFTDVPVTRVTDCSIQVTSRQEDAPVRNLVPFIKTISTTEPFYGQVNIEPDTPFIYLIVPELYVQNLSTPYSSENVSLSSGLPPNRSDSYWDIGVVTSYGIETIRYEAQDIWDKKNIQVDTGPLTMVSTIDNLACEIIYTGDEGQQTERCSVTVSFLFNQDENNLIPIKLSSYSQ